MKAKARHNINILMEDGRFSDFNKAKEYRCMFKGESVILIDEQRTGVIYDDRESFNKDFELIID